MQQSAAASEARDRGDPVSGPTSGSVAVPGASGQHLRRVERVKKTFWIVLRPERRGYDGKVADVVADRILLTKEPGA